MTGDPTLDRMVELARLRTAQDHKDHTDRITLQEMFERIAR
jgi:hypothetical protein